MAISTPAHVRALLRAALLDRQRLALESLALRQQVAVLRRGVKRPQLEDKDRIFWIGMLRLIGTWRDTLHIVKPDTVVRWHRRGWKYYWRRKSQPHTVGRPTIGWEIVTLIKRLSRENPLWCAPRIVDELALLGHSVAKATVDKYRVRHRPMVPHWAADANWLHFASGLWWSSGRDSNLLISGAQRGF